MAQTHRTLLERYRAQTTAGLWHTLPDDGYIYGHLTWHMEQAGQPQMVHELLQEVTAAGRNGWYIRCAELGKLATFVGDVDRGWRLAVEAFEQNPAKSLCLLWQYALIKTSLNSMAIAAPPALVAALIDQGVWPLSQGLTYVQQTPYPLQQASRIDAVAAHIPEERLPEVEAIVAQIGTVKGRAFALAFLAAHHISLLPQALAVIQQITDEADRDEALSVMISALSQLLSQPLQDPDRPMVLNAIAAHLPDLWPGLLQVNFLIRDGYAMPSTLAAIAAYLPEVLPQTLDLTQQTQGKFDRIDALRDLAPHLPEALWPAALDIVRQFEDENGRMMAIRAIAAHLPETHKPAVLDLIQQVPDRLEHAWALSDIETHLSERLLELPDMIQYSQDEFYNSAVLQLAAAEATESLLAQVLAQTQQFEEEDHRARILSDLAPYWPEPLLAEVLGQIQQFQDGYYSIKVLTALIPHLPEVLLGQVMGLIHQLDDESAQVEAMGALVARLPEPMLPQIFEIIQQLDPCYCPGVIQAIAPHLPERLLPEALEITQQLQAEPPRSRALSSLAPRLSESLLAQALTIAQQFSSSSYRTRAVSNLAPYLSAPLLSQALAITGQIQDEAAQAEAFCAIAADLPELLPEALDRLQQVEECDRCQYLGAIAPHLPAELWPKAFEIAESFQIEAYYIATLEAIAPHLPPELLPQALDISRQLSPECYDSALCTVAAYLPDSLLVHEFEGACQLDDEYARAAVLGAMAAYLPDSLLAEAFERIRQALILTGGDTKALCAIAARRPALWPAALESVSQHLYISCRALVEIVDQLPSEHLPQALELAQQIEDRESRTLAIAAVAARLPHLWPDIFERIQHIEDEFCRTEILAEIIPRLPPEHLSQALELVQQLQPKHRATSLKALAPRLPAALLPQFLDLIPQVDDEYNQAEALGAAASNLPPELLSRLLGLAQDIQSEAHRARALGAIAAHQPPEQLPQVLAVLSTLEDSYYRAVAWAGMLPQMEGLSPSFTQFNEVLDALTHLSRGQLLWAMPYLRPTITRLGGEPAVTGSLRATREVCQQWP
ncbi:MAG: hypothetical protein AAF289_11250 [Cyanobacteria bacterium P01_A01_bin.135]